RDRHAGALEQAEVIIPGGVAGQDVVEGRDVNRRKETAGVDLDAGQTEIGDDLQRLRQRPVVQDRVVDTQLHDYTCSLTEGCSATFADGMGAYEPPLAADSATADSSSMLWTPWAKVAHRGNEDASSIPATSSRNARAWYANASFWPKPTLGASIAR